MKSFSKILKTVSVMSLTLLMMQCGGSSSGTSGSSSSSSSNVETSAESNVKSSVTTATNMGSMTQSFASLSSVPPTLRLSVIKQLTQTVNCSTSGTFTIDFPDTGNEFSLAYDNCVEDSVTSDGSMTISWTESGSDFTGTMTYGALTITDEFGTFSADGSISMGFVNADSLYTYTFDITTTDESSNDMTITGELTETTSGILNGTLTSEYLTETVTCTFSDFDVNTATETEWAAACSVI